MSDDECQDDGDYNDDCEDSEAINDSTYYEEDYSEPSTPSPRAQFQPPPTGQFKFITEKEAFQHITFLCRECNLPDLALAEVLLIKNNWNIEKCLSDYFDESEDKALENIGLPKYDASVLRSRLNPSGLVGRTFTCPVCYCDYDESEGFAMNCDHWVCRDVCYKYHLESNISLDLKCPGLITGSDTGLNGIISSKSCTTRLVSPVFEKICEPKKYEVYRSRILTHFVSSNCLKNMKFCPGVSCSMICISSKAMGVVCPTCVPSFRFCFYCDHSQDHTPASCDQLKEWNKKSNDGDTLFAHWARDNGQRCPKCKFLCPKDSGCNHIKCGGHRGEIPGGCGFHFCYLCLGDWDKIGGYGHKGCNVYEANVETAGGFKARSELGSDDEDTGRFLHYNHRFDAHRGSEQFAIRDWDLFRSKVQDTNESSFLTGNTISSLQKAFGLVLQCRVMLKYSYIYGFFSYREKFTPGRATSSTTSPPKDGNARKGEKAPQLSLGLASAASEKGGSAALTVAAPVAREYLVEPVVGQSLFEHQQGLLEEHTERLTALLTALLADLKNEASDAGKILTITNQMKVTETFLSRLIEALKMD